MKKNNKNQTNIKTNKKNQKLAKFSKFENSMNLLDQSNLLFTLEEVEKVFPKPENNEETLEKEKQEQAKDYTIIRQENGKLQELLRYKLKYDLMVWQVFFEKCHELEDSYFIEDDLLEKSNRTNTIVPDITEREVKYRRQNKEYADKLIEEYNQKRYNNYVRMMTGEDQEIEETVVKHKYLYLMIAGISLILTIVNLFLSYSKTIQLIVTIVLALITLVMLSLFIFDKKVYKIKKYQAKTKPYKSYPEWCSENCISDEYLSKVAALKKSYLSLLKTEEEKLAKRIEIMKEIKTRMMEVIPVYKDYYTEEDMNYLLNAVMDRRCDTIRKAVKLAKEKEYQYDYLSSSERFIKEMNYVEDYKIYINEYTNLPIDKRTEFDKQIEKNNIIYNYLSRIHFDKTVIENEPFINQAELK